MIDGTRCDVQRYLNEVEGYCPPVVYTEGSDGGLASSPAAGYVGCYRTSGSESFTTIRHTITPEACAANCPDSPFYALNYHYRCACLSDVTTDQVDESDCSTSCEGDRSIMCGGVNRLSVYSSGGSTPEPPPPATTTEIPAPSPTTT